MMEFVEEAAKRVGYLFYIVKPQDYQYDDIKDVPEYGDQMIPVFFIAWFIEAVVARLRGYPAFRLNDSISSSSQGIILQMSKMLIGYIQLSAYIFVYKNFRIFDLPPDSYWTWLLGFLGADLGYYTLHRASHEINILWASHQQHHSSEEYNFSTAMRQSLWEGYTTWMFYLPLAIALPPVPFFVHRQMNMLFQFWVHTEMVNKLGPLEYFLNTPSNHRVHHGRNRYCIDKNYAGVLTIWDRMFGTYCPEDEKVVYGLTHPLNSFNPFNVQMNHYIGIAKRLYSTKGLGNKLSVLFKGPGWAPGKPRLGNKEDIPDVHYPVAPYDPQIPDWANVYVSLHFSITIAAHFAIAMRHSEFHLSTLLCSIFFILLTLTTIGALLDNKTYAYGLELFRCLLYLTFESYIFSDTASMQLIRTGMSWFYYISIAPWVVKLYLATDVKFAKKHLED